jgi:hypothetical protein
LTDRVDGFLRGAKYMIYDRDPHAERFVNTIKYE